MGKVESNNSDILWDRFISMFSAIEAQHAEEFGSVNNGTAADEQEALEILQSLIDSGNKSLYPLMALLSASNNWHSTLIVRMGQFQGILLEGIEDGCLSPDDEYGWMWLHAATEFNDPSDFFTDTESFRRLLSEAIDAGNDDARAIMNMISGGL